MFSGCDSIIPADKPVSRISVAHPDCNFVSPRRLAQSNGKCGSPYPMIDEFINSLVAKVSGGTGKIRSWLLSSSWKQSSSDGEGNRHGVGGQSNARVQQKQIPTLRPSVERVTLTYQVTNCRWCENIGRAHKSNHIYWVVDVTNGSYCQRCHDPECRFFSSQKRPLPTSCQSALTKV